MTMQPHLAIIIVSWNVRDLLRHCLHAVEASLSGTNIAYTILVVDNASHDGTPAMVRQEFPHVQLLEPGRNLGFAGGNNVALRELGFIAPQSTQNTQSLHTAGEPTQPTTTYPSAILLLNPDTEPVGDALPRLLRYLEQHPELVAVGPQLRYPDGCIQSSRRRFPTRLTFFWESTILARLWPRNPWNQRYSCADKRDDVAHYVDWLVGAALLVRGEAIARVGLLNEAFFMYSEELEWQKRLAQGGGAIGYFPDAVILHHEAKSSEQVPATRHIAFQRSKVQLARLWYGEQFAWVVRWFLLLSYVWELCVEGAKHFMGHLRPLRRQRIGVYAHVVCSLLK